MIDRAQPDGVYELYRRGCELLGHGDYQAAIVPLTRAREREPGKASIREALARALFHAQRYEAAAREFGVLAAERPTDDYALFCLGRSMQLLGRHREACRSPARCGPSAATTASTGNGRCARATSPRHLPQAPTAPLLCSTESFLARERRWRW
jgi:predicted Zn-dependent protease